MLTAKIFAFDLTTKVRQVRILFSTFKITVISADKNTAVTQLILKSLQNIKSPK